jgi:hypothetical protein
MKWNRHDDDDKEGGYDNSEKIDFTGHCPESLCSGKFKVQPKVRESRQNLRASLALNLRMLELLDQLSDIMRTFVTGTRFAGKMLPQELKKVIDDFSVTTMFPFFLKGGDRQSDSNFRQDVGTLRFFWTEGCESGKNAAKPAEHNCSERMITMRGTGISEFSDLPPASLQYSSSHDVSTHRAHHAVDKSSYEQAESRTESGLYVDRKVLR